METTEVRDLVQAALPGADVSVEGEGCNFTVIAVSTAFEGLPLVRRQQRVLHALQAVLASGALHAITVKTHTPDEWLARSAEAVVP
jgi:acid stress-induced BolA-like protein IbaG/YrbA